MTSDLRSRKRWSVGVLLFAASVINYIDRQTLSALAPILKAEFHWTNSDFASLLIAFRIAYTVMQGTGGWLFDRLGSRVAFPLIVSFYSLVAMATTFAQGLVSFRIFRFLLGMGEGPNFPGAAKTVAEWFPAKERAWAVALFDSGTSIGGAAAPFIVLYAYKLAGTWRPPFVLTGCLGLIWVLVWMRFYRAPQRPTGVPAEPAARWRDLLRYRQTWGIILGRFLLDPFWFFVSESFAFTSTAGDFS